MRPGTPPFHALILATVFFTKLVEGGIAQLALWISCILIAGIWHRWHGGGRWAVVADKDGGGPILSSGHLSGAWTPRQVHTSKWFSMDWLSKTCLWKVAWWSVFSELYISQHKLSLFIHKTRGGWGKNKDGITDLDSSSHSPHSDGCHCWSLLLLLLLLLLWDFVDGNVDGDVYRPDNGADYDQWFLHTGGKKCCSNSCSSIFCKSSCARWAPQMIITDHQPFTQQSAVNAVDQWLSTEFWLSLDIFSVLYFLCSHDDDLYEGTCCDKKL